MHGYWHFDIVAPLPSRSRRLIVFCSLAHPEVEDLVECITGYCDNQIPPDEILLIAPASERGALAHILAQEPFRERVRAVTRYVDAPAVKCLLFDAEGRVVDMESTVVDPQQIRRLVRIGLTHLVHSQPVYHSSASSHHFVLPSGKHSQGFFRIGSAMVDGAAIDFMAFSCLPHIPLDVKHIYCDTGTISPIAYAVNCLRQRIDHNTRPATVSSFGSYRGMGSFKFRDIERAVILLSLTSGGGLAPRLCENDPNIPRDAIVILFSLHAPDDFRNVVCDLRHDPAANPEGFEAIQPYDANQCPLCAGGSTSVLISGEQFLPGNAPVSSVMLRARHAPVWLSPFLRQTVGTGLIHANYRAPGTRHASADVFLDLEALFGSPDMLGITQYRRRLDWLVNQVVSAKLTRIIYLDSPASEAMAKVIAAQMRPQLDRIPLVAFSTIIERPGDYVAAEGSTLVAAAAIASGRSLLAVAQRLRYIQTNGAVTYIVGLARMQTPDAFSELESNVAYGEQPRDHGFYVLDKVYAPLVSPHYQTSWEQELELLNGLINGCEDPALRARLETRLNAIRRASSTAERGMRDTLFWTKPDETPLTLRPGFAYYDFIAERGSSQADVFFTITSVLHHLRALRGAQDSLCQHEYLRRVISPRCFDRFNDGVIQSSLLRAALQVELDYSIDELLSNEMSQFLDFIFSSIGNEPGEAAREFLLALALKRVRLTQDDINRLKAGHEGDARDPVAKLLWTAIN